MQQHFIIFIFLGHCFSNIVDISDQQILDLEEEIFEYDDDIQEEENKSCLDSFLKEIEIKSCIYSSTVGDRLNAYYIPEFKTCLMRICKKFPMWTNVMVPFFKSPYLTASSASVEGEFSQLKNLILKHESRLLSADRFVLMHLQSLENSMKIVRNEQLFPNKTNLVNDYLEKINPCSATSTTRISNNSDIEKSCNLCPDDLNYNDVISDGNTTSSSSQTSISDDILNTEECWRGLQNIRTGPLLNSREKNKTTKKDSKTLNEQIFSSRHMPSIPKKKKDKIFRAVSRT